MVVELLPKMLWLGYSLRWAVPHQYERWVKILRALPSYRPKTRLFGLRRARQTPRQLWNNADLALTF